LAHIKEYNQLGIRVSNILDYMMLQLREQVYDPNYQIEFIYYHHVLSQY